MTGTGGSACAISAIASASRWTATRCGASPSRRWSARRISTPTRLRIARAVGTGWRAPIGRAPLARSASRHCAAPLSTPGSMLRTKLSPTLVTTPGRSWSAPSPSWPPTCRVCVRLLLLPPPPWFGRPHDRYPKTGHGHPAGGKRRRLAGRRCGPGANPESGHGLGREDRRSDLDYGLHPARFRLHGLGRALRHGRDTRGQAADGRHVGCFARQAALDLHSLLSRVEE